MGTLSLLTSTATTLFTGVFVLAALVLAFLSWPALTSTTKMAALFAFVVMMYDGIVLADSDEMDMFDLGASGVVTLGITAVMNR